METQGDTLTPGSHALRGNPRRVEMGTSINLKIYVKLNCIKGWHLILDALMDVPCCANSLSHGDIWK